MIFLLIIGIIIIVAGLFVAIYQFDITKMIIGLIMVLTGILDIPLAFKFKSITTKNIQSMPAEEAYRRYCKIYGLQDK